MNAITLDDINVSIDATQPRIQDLKLAEALGFVRPRKIREIVERHIKALKLFGNIVCPTVGQTPKGGRPGKEYWLNEKQALYLCTKSEAQNAIDITIQMVEVFHAVKTGRYRAGGPDPVIPDYNAPMSNREWLALIRETRLANGIKAAQGIYARSPFSELLTGSREEAEVRTDDEWVNLADGPFKQPGFSITRMEAVVLRKIHDNYHNPETAHEISYLCDIPLKTATEIVTRLSAFNLIARHPRHKRGWISTPSGMEVLVKINDRRKDAST